MTLSGCRETSDLSALVPGLDPQTVGYRYDGLGRRSELDYPDHTKASYAYDARNRLTAIDTQGGGHTPLATYYYDAHGRIAKLTRDNGVDTAYTYDMAGQLTDITHANGGTVLASARYTLDQFGRRTAQAREDGVTETHGYDAIGQLTTVDYGDPSRGQESFSYDRVGNRVQSTLSTLNPQLSTTSYTTNTLNQYTRVNNTPFAYDANGNLVNDGKQRYRYDAQNRLIAVEPAGAIASGSAKAEFYYDARNRCVLRNYATADAQGRWQPAAGESRALTYDTGWNLIVE